MSGLEITAIAVKGGYQMAYAIEGVPSTDWVPVGQIYSDFEVADNEAQHRAKEMDGKYISMR